jgi:hypothetical protein
MRTVFPARRFARLGLALAGGAAVALPLGSAAITTQAAAPLAVGIPTVVDPIRGVGEPDMIVDNRNNAVITGPGGSGTQTSFFWRSRDGGLSYPLLGPSQGHWVCPASGGGDSLVVQDRKTGDIYLTDQEALADIGSAKLSGSSGAVTKQCATAPGVTADRPFEAVLNSSAAPQGKAAGKPLLYLSWLCSGCLGVGGSNGPTVGGLAFGWSDDGVTFHAADPGVAADTPITNTFQEAGTINNFQWHGNMVADPRTGYVYTALSCGSNSCPNGAAGNEIGVVVGAPQTVPNPANVGQFSSLSYQSAVTTDPDGQPMRQTGSLFPVVGMDRNGTLYEAYIEGDGGASPSAALPDSAWHLYYTYSTDAPLHKTWTKPVQVDHGPQTKTSDFGWMAVGDPGKLGFVWLGTDKREHPSAKDSGAPRQWHPFMAITTNGLDASPTFQQQQVGIGPNHLNDMCLQGTIGCIVNVGNRNMADFISCDIGPDGALQAVWANDSNRLATNPTTLIPGLPLTETARQVSGPRLIGKGSVANQDSRFSTKPTSGIKDARGDALYPVDATQGAQHNVPQLDLTASRIEWVGSNMIVHVDAANLADTSSPSSTQGNVWYLTTWQFNHTIYFARAQSNHGGPLSFAAGPAKSFDRPGLNAQTVATLVDYSGGTIVQGSRQGNDIAITVPASVVGNPSTGSLLEVVTAFTALDNGAPLLVGPGSGNIPTVTDATPAYDTVLTAPAGGHGGVALTAASGGGSSAADANAGRGGGGAIASAPDVAGDTVVAEPVSQISAQNTTAALARAPLGAGLAVLALGGMLWLGRRRRGSPGRAEA